MYLKDEYGFSVDDDIAKLSFWRYVGFYKFLNLVTCLLW